MKLVLVDNHLSGWDVLKNIEIFESSMQNCIIFMHEYTIIIDKNLFSTRYHLSSICRETLQLAGKLLELTSIIESEVSSSG